MSESGDTNIELWHEQPKDADIPATAVIETFTGRLVDVANMTISDVTIRDIAHALSLEPRFGGHTREQYSVARHSLNVLKVLDVVGNFHCMPEMRLAALLHDAHEAYTKDLMRPLRQLPGLAPYNELCRRVQLAITRRFRITAIPVEGISPIAQVDNGVLFAEAARLLVSGGAGWPRPSDLLTVDPDSLQLTRDAEQDEDDFLDAFLGCW